MEIRQATPADLPRMLAIYARARAFMAANGNPDQWGPTNWPPEKLLHEDIAVGRSFVCIVDGEVAGVFCYLYGEDIDATYRVIEDGAWSQDRAYGVVHRLASDGTKGVGTFCMQWALKRSGYLRVDTHPDNQPMQRMMDRLGFRKCGIIHVVEDPYPRYAYDCEAEA